MEKSLWENHYQRDKSILTYPDENLVRLLRNFIKLKKDGSKISALDLGCGSGRHMILLEQMGISDIIGMDNSSEALKLCNEHFPYPIIRGDNRQIPLKSNSIDVIVAWGSLHYSHKKYISDQVDEIYRVLKPGGFLFATLRSNRDTHMKKGKHLGKNSWITNLNDISGSVVSFYRKKELNKIFKGYDNFEMGIMERTLMGDMKKRISHWVVHASKR